MRIFFILLTLLFPLLSVGQQRIIDSLESLLSKITAGRQQVDLLNELSLRYAPSNSLKGSFYATRALSTSRSIKYKKGEVISLHRTGTCLYYRNRYDSALAYYDSSLAIAHGMADSMEITRILNNKGQACYYKGNYSEAMEYYLEAIKICEKINHKPGLGSAMNNMGQIFTAQGQFEKAIEYFEKTRELRTELNDKEGLAQTLNSLGNIFSYKQEFKRALDYYFSALKLMEELNYLNAVASITNNIGGMYGEMKEYDLAITWFNKAMQVYTRSGDSSGVGSSLSNIGLVFLLKGDNEKALSFCMKALRVALRTGHRRLIKNTYHDLAKIYRKEGDYKNALDYYQRYSDIKDSLLNEATTKQIAEMQTKYETGKKQKEIELLNRDKIIKTSELKRQRMVIWGTVIGIIVLSGFLALLFNRFRVIRRQKRLIEKQKQMVEEAHRELKLKNEDILDSIQYAKRIQVALLTGKEYFDKYLREYFIFYRPKDVVSGDFYYLTPLPQTPSPPLLDKERGAGGEVVLAVCDCTGHGVPGAFMSLLGISFLNEIIIERKIISPDEVLNSLRQEIIHSLNPEGKEDIQDGMDMVICRMDFANKKFDFSGANAGIMVAHNGAITEFRGDDMPIGAGSGKTSSFSLQSVSLEKGDTVYMFTDGIRDQHGGARNKKMGRKGLRELLLKMSSSSMREQEKMLENEFAEWKGINEQTDDVTVVGIRI